MLSILHTSISVKVRNTETPTGHCSTITCSTILLFLKRLHCPINTDTILTTYIHLCQGMQYQDAYRTPQYHHILTMTPLSSIHHARLIIIKTNSLITAYMHQYRDTRPAPSQHQALGHNTDRPIMVILAHCSICTARHWHLWFHMATTSGSGPPDSTLTRHRHRSSLPWLHSPRLLNTGPPNIGHSVAFKARYQDGYAPCYSWTCCPGKLDLFLYRMMLLSLARAGGGGGVGLQERQLFPLSLISIKSLSLSM
jgi:hypothetical protein